MIAVISFYGYPGSIDHIKVQGEILEGLVARIVGHESSKHMEEVLREYPPPPVEGGMMLCLVYCVHISFYFLWSFGDSKSSFDLLTVLLFEVDEPIIFFI